MGAAARATAESERVGDEPAWLMSMCTAGILVNALFAVFNMLPIPPLDGSRVLRSFVSPGVGKCARPARAIRVLHLARPLVRRCPQPAAHAAPECGRAAGHDTERRRHALKEQAWQVTQGNKRVVSGMRPTGRLHLGNYHGALRNWTELQYQYECYFFVADWHALTTGYADTSQIEENVREVVIDWLGAGLNPGVATFFVQSRVPEHAELHLLLSMITPLGWLERVPTYKDQIEQLKETDLTTYGFLGYPLLQSADILIYKPAFVPVGEDQVAHVEITREIARRFNHLYGREPDFEQKAEKAIKSLGGRNSTLYRQHCGASSRRPAMPKRLEKARALVESNARLTIADRERLLGISRRHGCGASCPSRRSC